MADNRYKHWAWTLNNYTDDNIESLRERLTPIADYVIWGKEVGEQGTPHLQGFISFKVRKRFANAKAAFGIETVHIERAHHPEQAADYCKKDGDFEEIGTFGGGQGKRSDLDTFCEAVNASPTTAFTREFQQKHNKVFAAYNKFAWDYIYASQPKKTVTPHPLRPWQQQLNATLNLEPDPRQIIFIVDIQGNNGKSWFSHYYSGNHDNVQIITPGKKADMASALLPHRRVIFFDCPRAKQQEFIQYDFLEECKNGYVFVTKYNSHFLEFKTPHVVVFMNEHPDMTKLSQDRYNVIVI